MISINFEETAAVSLAFQRHIRSCLIIKPLPFIIKAYVRTFESTEAHNAHSNAQKRTIKRGD